MQKATRSGARQQPAASRPPADIRALSDRTLAWEDIVAWRRRIWPVIEPHLGRVRGAPLAPGTRLTERSRERLRARLRRKAAVSALAAALPRLYDRVRLFHGCRPVDVTSYYTCGIKPLDRTHANAAAYTTFLAGAFPELTRADVDAAIEEVGSHLREDRVYFCFDGRELVEYCGHYLIYGSEYLFGVGASLMRLRRRRDGRSPDYREALKRIGIPTLLIVDLPLALLRRSTVREIAEALLDGVGLTQGVADEALREAPADRSGFWTDQVVPPAHIAGHTHPESIPDWHTLDGGLYRWRRDHRASSTAGESR